MELYPQKWHLPSFPISAGSSDELRPVSGINHLVENVYYYIQLPDTDLVGKVVKIVVEDPTKFIVVKTLYKRKTGNRLGAWTAGKELDPNYYLDENAKFFVRSTQNPVSSAGTPGTFEFDMHHFQKAKDLGRSILRFTKKQSKPLTAEDIAATDKLYEPYNTARTNTLF
jgi:hypothetical protein